MSYYFLDHFKTEPLTEDMRGYLFQDFDAEDPEELKVLAYFDEQEKKFDFSLLGIDIYDGVNDDAVIIEKFEKTLKLGVTDHDFTREQQINRSRVYVTIVRLSGKIVGFDESAIAED